MSLKATNNVETNKYELEIEISAEDFEAAIEKAYLKARKNTCSPYSFSISFLGALPLRKPGIAIFFLALR